MGRAALLIPLLLLLTLHSKSVVWVSIIMTPPLCTDTKGQFSVVPADVRVNETEAVTITCSYPNASSILWMMGGEAIDDGMEVAMMNGFNISSSMAGESLLIIDPASFELHNGSYSCVAVLEDGGTDVAPFCITVQCECVGVTSANPFTH